MELSVSRAVLKQIKFPDELWESINHQKETLQVTRRSLCELAIQWYLLQRRAQALPRSYSSSPTSRGRYRSLQVGMDFCARVRALSEQDGVSDNRVIYTALEQYCSNTVQQRASNRPRVQAHLVSGSR